MSLAIRSAEPADAGLIVKFIAALAEYEKLSHEAKATEADIVRDLFGEQPKVFCEIAEYQGKPVGFSLWFYTYSTFQGRYGIWLEDLFVNPEARGLGVKTTPTIFLDGTRFEGLDALRSLARGGTRPAAPAWESLPVETLPPDFISSACLLAGGRAGCRVFSRAADSLGQASRRARTDRVPGRTTRQWRAASPYCAARACSPRF